MFSIITLVVFNPKEASLSLTRFVTSIPSSSYWVEISKIESFVSDKKSLKEETTIDLIWSVICRVSKDGRVPNTYFKKKSALSTFIA